MTAKSRRRKFEKRKKAHGSVNPNPQLRPSAARSSAPEESGQAVEYAQGEQRGITSEEAHAGSAAHFAPERGVGEHGPFTAESDAELRAEFAASGKFRGEGADAPLRAAEIFEPATARRPAAHRSA